VHKGGGGLVRRKCNTFTDFDRRSFVVQSEQYDIGHDDIGRRTLIARAAKNSSSGAGANTLDR
jgi:hypothetical protein